MGHAEAFSGGDVVARYRAMRGNNVLHPIGWDAFGLPAENAAIKRGVAPGPWTLANIEQQAASFKRMGMSFDWSRRLATCDPDYYRWTQWLFLRFFEAGLAYRKESPVNWCPKDATVLANEQVIKGACERCGTMVERRNLTQWFFKITDYAQRLLDDAEGLVEWPERVLTMQRNWIGRSEGAEVTFTIEETGEEITIFTTRPDTLWGATFFVFAAEHPAVRRLAELAGTWDQVEPLVRAAEQTSLVDREAADTRRGRVPRRACGQPRQRGADPVLRGAVRADGVRDGRDHGGARARPARLRVRETARHRGPGRRAARGRRGARRGHDDRGVRRRGRDGRQRTVRRPFDPGLDRRGDRLARDPGPREARGQLPAARLADQPSAVLGPADPDRALPDVRGGRGARRRAAGAAARGRGLPAGRRRPVGPPPDVEARPMPVVRRRGAARHRHVGHVRRFELVLLPVLLAGLRGRTVPPRGRRPVDAGRPVHRRGRARDPAPALLAVRHQGALRPGDGRLHRAVPAPDEPGAGDLRRRLDVEVEGQHRRADAARGAVGRRHDAADDAVRRARSRTTSTGN